MFEFEETLSDHTVVVHDGQSQDISDAFTNMDRFPDRDIGKHVLLLPTVNDNRSGLGRCLSFEQNLDDWKIVTLYAD